MGQVTSKEAKSVGLTHLGAPERGKLSTTKLIQFPSVKSVRAVAQLPLLVLQKAGQAEQVIARSMGAKLNRLRIFEKRTKALV